MKKIKLLCLLLGLFLLTPAAWAETLLVTGTIPDNYTIYDSFGRTYQATGTVNKEIQIAPATYQLTYHNSVLNVTVIAGQKTIVNTGLITVSGTGQDRFYLYDELAKSSISNSYTNASIEVFPGNYVVQLNYFNSAVIAVTAGQTTNLAAGKLSVTGAGWDSYAVYDAFGKTSVTYAYSTKLTNNYMELLPGTYSAVLNGTKQTAIVQAGQNTTLISGSYTVFGASLDSVDIYDANNSLSLSLSHKTNREVEIFPGTYTLRLNGTTQKVTVNPAQKSYLYDGVLKTPNLGDAGRYHAVYNTLGTQLFLRLPDAFTEVFPGTFKVTLDALSTSVVVNAGDNIPADVSKNFPSATGSTTAQTTSTTPSTATSTTSTAAPSYSDGVAAGIVQCKANPSTCSIVVNQNTDGSTQTGIDKCKADPASCGISVSSVQVGIDQCKANPAGCGIVVNNNIDGSTQAGIDQCKANPSACGIVVNQNTNGSTDAGIAQCKANPSACGIIVNQNTDGSTQTGIDKCKADPASCNIAVTPNTDGSTQAGITQCKADPASCGIVVDNRANYNPISGELHLPIVEVGAETYEVYLKQKPQGFLFDLDMTRIVKRN